jgi:hypothetical protein
VPVAPNAKLTPWADNDSLNTTNVNGYLRDPLRFLLLKPICQVRQGTAQTVVTATWSDMNNMTIEDIDTDPDGVGGHSTSTNTARFTARYPGWYRLGGGVSTAAGTGVRGARFAVNSTAVTASESVIPATSGQPTSVPARSVLVALDEGDYATIQGYHSNGSNLDTYIGSGFGTSLTAVLERLRVGDA